MKKLFLLFIALSFSAYSFSQKKDSVFVLKEVSITSAYKVSSKAPITEKTINGEYVKKFNFGQEVPVILTKTPSVTSHSDGGHYSGYTYMRLRGMDQTRVSFTLNGVPMNEPEDQGFYSSNFPDFISSMSSVSVQRGVGSSNYGVSSYAGSVNFESARLTDSAYTQIESTIGSYNSIKNCVEINTGVKNGFGFYSRASASQSDGYRNHAGNSGYSSFISGGYFGKKNIVKMNIFNGQAINRMAWLGSDSASLSTDNKNNPNSSSEYDNFFQSFVHLQDIFLVNKNSSITASVFYNKLDGNWDQEFNSDYYSYGELNGDVRNYKLSSSWSGAMVNYKYIKDKFRFNAGAHSSYYERGHSLSKKSEPDSLFHKNKGKKETTNLYSKIELDAEIFTFFVDLQYSIINFKYAKDKIGAASADIPNKEWKFFNPRAGVSCNINKAMQLYVSIGKTSREPTRTDMFGGEDNIYYVNEHRDTTNYIDIKEENVVDLEIGTKINYKNLTATANVFFMDFSNEITLSGAVGGNGLPLCSNVKESYRRGLELDVNYNSKYVTYNNSMSIMQAGINTGGAGVISPVMTPNLIVKQTIGFNYKSTSLYITHSYVGDRFINLENTNLDYYSYSDDTTITCNINTEKTKNYKIPSSHSFDVAVVFKYKKHDIIFGVNNAFQDDKAGTLSYSNGYISTTSPARQDFPNAGVVPYYFVECPRNFFVTLHLNF